MKAETKWSMKLTFAVCSVKAFDRDLGFYIEAEWTRRLLLVSTR